MKLAALSAAAPAARLRSSGKRAAESTELDEGHRTPLRSHSRSRRQTFGSGRAATVKDNIWRRPTSAAVQLREETHESPDTILHHIHNTSKTITYNYSESYFSMGGGGHRLVIENIKVNN